MKTILKRLLLPALLLTLFASVSGGMARADAPRGHWHHPYRHYARLDKRGHRVTRRGVWMINHGHPYVGAHMVRRGARMDRRADRWQRHHGMPDQH